MRVETLKAEIIHEQVTRMLFWPSENLVDGIAEQLVKDAEELVGIKKIQSCSEQTVKKKNCDKCSSTIICGKEFAIQGIVVLIRKLRSSSLESVDEACQRVTRTLLGETKEELLAPFKELAIEAGCW